MNPTATPGREIERQFLLARPAAEIIHEARCAGRIVGHEDIVQAYLADSGSWTLRVRVTHRHDRAPVRELTLKRSLGGIERIEENLALDPATAARMLALCGPAIRKRRTTVSHARRLWQIDVFENPALSGLELVEVEIESPDARVDLPPWVGSETTHDPSYRNAAIAARLGTRP